MSNSTSPTPVWRKILKIVAWTLMAAVLIVVATGICMVSVLDPPHLTRLSEKMANRVLDADVNIGRAEISIASTFPYLRLDVDSLVIVSSPIRRLEAKQRDSLPDWADTLVSLKHLRAGVNLLYLLKGSIALHDVILTRPAINLATLNADVSNFQIYQSTDTTSTEGPVSVPDISVNRFALENPYPIRYYNAMTGQHFELLFNTVSLDNVGNPNYALEVNGDIKSPQLATFDMRKLQFGLDGQLGWSPKEPMRVNLKNFKVRADFLEALVSADIDFEKDLIIQHFDFDFGRMSVACLLDAVPDSIKESYHLTSQNFNTDLAIAFSGKSTSPFNLTTDSIPHADLTLDIVPGSLRYGRTTVHNLSGQLHASLQGNNLNAATFTARDLNIAGPATDLTINGNVTRIMSDPIIKAKVHGHTELLRLPEVITKMFGGYLSGRVTADVEIEGAPSMLTRNNFHLLRVNGDIDADRVYYLSADTNNMINLNHACLRFGTNTRVKTATGYADSLLTASVEVDTAEILSNNFSINVGKFKLGAGAMNRWQSADSTLIIPMGGRVEIGAFSLMAISDSLRFNMRGASGAVKMTRYQGEATRPQFDFNLDVRRMSMGGNEIRFMLSRSHLKFHAHKLPPRKVPPHIKATADSLHKAYPYLPMDSVYRYAVRKHRHRPGHIPRVHLEYTPAEAEIIYWGTSTNVRKLLLNWDIAGELTASRAGLFTPYFPLRNRVRDFNMRFDNDSIYMQNVRYKAGHSDFLLSGRISNMKGGFTSRGFRSPLKLNFDILSDTIDVNELAGGAFKGAAYAAADSTGGGERQRIDLESLEHSEAVFDDNLEHEIGRHVIDSPDSVAPLLIPRNIDVQIDVKANNVLYSDFVFHDFSGQLLAYKGAINLHHLNARSDVGNLNLSALYSGSSAKDLKFGFGMQVNDFRLNQFTRLVPAVDSIMPLLRDVSGVVDADIAATCDIDSGMNLVLPTLTAAIRLSGDSLVLIDKETYRNIGKWLLFKDKQSNVIDHMNVEVIVRDNEMELYPFEFDIDRYKLGIQGYNDLAMNFNYHIAVLKSPIPFKFGINIKGTPEKYKIRLGRARFNQNEAARTVSIVDTARVNLLQQIENIFRRGVADTNFASVEIGKTPTAESIDLNADTISHADSLLFIQEGLIPAPEPPAQTEDTSKSKGKRRKNKDTSSTPRESQAVLPDKVYVCKFDVYYEG